MAKAKRTRKAVKVVSEAPLASGTKLYIPVTLLEGWDHKNDRRNGKRVWSSRGITRTSAEALENVRHDDDSGVLEVVVIGHHAVKCELTPAQ